MSWKVIWSSLKSADMRKRLLAVMGMLFVFRIFAHIPVPLADPTTLKQILENVFTSSETPQLFSFINVLSGGALANFSIMLVGLGPYINASIILQLLTKAIPQLEALNKEGEYGRKKINQYTRILTLPLAIMQSIGAIYLVRQSASSIGGLGDITANTSLMQWVLMVCALTGGSMILMWLGELITEQNVGNGISLIITVGIVSSLPGTIGSLLTSVINENEKWNIFGRQLPIDQQGLLYTLLIVAIVTIVTVLVVKLNEASRNITINYAKRVQGNRSYGGVTTTLPVKLITAGVIPIIFAVAFLSVPSFVGQLMTSSSSARLQSLGAELVKLFQNPTAQTFQQPGWQPYIYPLVYFILVFAFTFFYTSIAFNTKEIAENLQKQGGFIEGVRIGAQTEKYLGKVVNRLTLFGALSLGMLALMPILGQKFLTTNISLGGTSLLILVSVALETLRQIESRALMATYDQYTQDDFFYDSSEPAQAATGGRRLRFIPKTLKRSGKKSDNSTKSKDN
ncbi:preprotein translocase subunit SecY [Candidatus Saccharibacteria bacterium]|nr:preprotein translocase subunit SecY [Candidatus Saccharibacteria bacterium]